MSMVSDQCAHTRLPRRFSAEAHQAVAHGLRDVRDCPGSNTVEQLPHRRAVERLLSERCLVPELDAEGIELRDSVEI